MVMKLPMGLVRCLVDVVVCHYTSQGFVADAVTIGEMCGGVARAWAHQNADEVAGLGVDVESVVAFGRRFGKCVGEFFEAEREG